jgi:osmoprotectant transport system ATP-binding protein
VEEALYLADRLIVMDKSKVLQYDTSFNVIAHPANEFVAKLIGADDVMRLLGLVTVRNVLQPLQSETAQHAEEVLNIDDSIRDVLAKLLRSRRDALPVTDASGELVGQCDLKTVRERLRRPTTLEPDRS